MRCSRRRARLVNRQSTMPMTSMRNPTTMHAGPKTRELPVKAILAAYVSGGSSSPGPRYDAAVRTHPTRRKRNPKMGRTIWQLAATTTPATIRPPSIFSTRSLEMGAGHCSLFAAPIMPHPWFAVGAAASTGTSLGILTYHACFIPAGLRLCVVVLLFRFLGANVITIRDHNTAIRAQQSHTGEDHNLKYQ